MAGPLLHRTTKRSSFSNYRPPMADINITPFVDVMLVLLIVFMVTAPLITQGVQVSLPEVESAPITEQQEPLQVTIKADGSAFLQSQQLSTADLIKRLQAVRKVRPNTAILLRADKVVPYGKVMEIMGALQMAGLVDISMVTESQKVSN